MMEGFWAVTTGPFPDIRIQFGKWHPFLLGSSSVSPEGDRAERMDLFHGGACWGAPLQ